MISYLAAYSLKLKNDDFDQTITESKHPLLLRLVDGSDLCSGTAHHWEYVENDPDMYDEVAICEVNCHEESEICDKFTFNQAPGYFWIDAHNASQIRYDCSNLDYSHLTHWAKKQLNQPFWIVDEIDVPEYKEYANSTAVFLFRIPSTDSASLDIITNVTTKYRSIEASFLVEVNSTIKRPTLEVFRGAGIVQSFDSKFSAHNIDEFIRLNQVAFLGTLTGKAFELVKDRGEKAMVILHESEKSRADFIDLALNVSDLIQVYEAECEYLKSFCEYVETEDPCFTIYDPLFGTFWREKDLTGPALREWTQDVLGDRIEPTGPEGVKVTKFQQVMMNLSQQMLKFDWETFGIPIIFVVAVVAILINVLVSRQHAAEEKARKAALAARKKKKAADPAPEKEKAE